MILRQASKSSRPLARRAIIDGRLRWAVVAATIFLIVAGVQMYLVRLKPNHGDLAIYRNASALLFERPAQSVYVAESGYVYPLLLTILLRPFAAVPDGMFSLVWDIARYISYAFSLLLCYRRLQTFLPSTRAQVVAIAFCFAMLCRSMHHDTYCGNVNAFLVLGIAAGWSAFEKRRPLLAGILWSIVVSIKPTYVFIALAAFAASRRDLLRCWLGGTIGILVANVVLPVVCIGFGNTATQIADYPRGVAETPIVFTKFRNQALGVSMVRVAHRLFGDPEVPPGIEEVKRVQEVLGGVALLCGVLLVFCASRWSPIAPLSFALAASCLLILLVSPVVWYAQYLVLLPVLVVLIGASVTLPSAVRRTSSFAAIAFAAGVLGINAPILNTIVWTPLLFLFLLALLMRRNEDTVRSRPSQPRSVRT